jgi:hypothetical protein
MNDDIPYNEYKRYKNYQMFMTYMINKETDLPYVKMKIYYKEKEIYNESIYGERRYTTEEIYDSVCKAHIRNRKINQLLK